MIRAVLDTNLLASYLLTHRLPVATPIDRHLGQEDSVLVTAPELLAELDQVLGNRKLQRYYTKEDRTRFVALVMALSEVVDLPETIPRVCRDPDDNRVIGCAVVGEADVIGQRRRRSPEAGAGGRHSYPLRVAVSGSAGIGKT